MITFNELTPLKLVRGIMFLPIGEVEKTKGNVVFVNTPDMKSTIECLNNKLYKNRALYPGYYTDFRFKFSLFNKGVSINNTDKQTADFVNIKDACPLIKKTYKNITQYKGFNMFYDLSRFNMLFFDTLSKRKSNNYTLTINNYISILELFSQNITQEYTNKYMIIDILNWGDDLKSSDTYKNISVNSPFKIFMNLLRNNLERFKTLPFTLIIKYGNYNIKIVPSECVEETYQTLKSLFSRMYKAKIKDETGIDEDTFNKPSTINNNPTKKVISSNPSSFNIKNEDKKPDMSTIEMDSKLDDAKKIVTYNLTNKLSGKDLIQSFTGKNDLMNAIDDTINETVDELKKSGQIKDSDDLEQVEEKTKEALEKNEDFMSDFELAKNDRITNLMSAGNLARNKQLAEKQSKIEVNGKSIDAILEDLKSNELPHMEVSTNIINEDMKKLRLPNLDKMYNDKGYESDTVQIVNFFKDRSIPVYILDVKKEDTSDDFNKKVTWTVKMESADRQRHTLTFDMPRFIDNSFLFLNGNKKSMYKQLTLLPISKTAPDTVQICTNYNKVFITRVGDKISPKIERVKKIIPSLASTSFVIKNGDNTKVNFKFKTHIEYDELAKNFIYIDAKKIKTVFFFNQDLIREQCDLYNLKIPNDDNILPFAIVDKSKLICLDLESGNIIGTQLGPIDFMIGELNKVDSEFEQKLLSQSTGKRFMYAKAKIMAKDVPVILLLAYLEGLTTILKKANIKHEFSDKRPILKGNDKNNRGVIEFKDGFLTYEKEPLVNSLLLNAMSIIPTKDYNYSDFDDKRIYLDIFDDLFGMKKIANVFDNFYDLLIDPISYQVLSDHSMPTEFADIFIYAVSLLEDNAFMEQKHMNICRLRSNEIANAILYKTLATAYESYRVTAGNKSPVKMSIPRDKVIKNLLMLNTVEDYSTLNPTLESEKLRAVSFKGASGMNLDRAYTMDMRSYDDTMLGIIAMSSPPSGTIGIVRQLPLDSNVSSMRGYLETYDKDYSKLKTKNLFSPAELLIPECVQKDDAPRVAMATTQAKHVVPCKKYDKLLIGNGMDRMLSKIISNDFAFKAKDDGKVIKLDTETNVMIVQYKNGEKDAIELRVKIAKNGGGGFYIVNQLETKLKEGSTFKKDDILAFNSKFFDQSENGDDAIFKSGTLTKIALAQGYYTYEDSSMVSEKLTSNMSTEIVMKKDVVLGPNSNIEKIVSVGDKVEVGDPLLVFDDSYDDEGINKMLASMGEDIGKEISNLGKKPIKSKYSGTIVDIKVYYTVDEDKMSKSLRDTIKKINKSLDKARKLISEHIDINKSDLVIQPTKKIESPNGKIKGIDVGEGVLIEFYIKYNDRLKVGDKITFFCALKSVICDTIPRGLEPFTVNEPDEEVSAFLSPSSVLKRMTGSILPNMFGNKVLVELKKKVKKVYEK